ncbi:hypothetical protein G6F21_011943 [Rhizopus arrhizus]|nr:hypothetical protein G6F21_011943 [Rhizopus arrhizus]
MTTYNTGHIALANNYNYKPVPVDFHGYEDENFRYFLERLESYLAINNVHDAREQEHPRIFLARLREAADLANIEDEAVIGCRFRAGLQPEIKRFCIQSSSKTLKDWLNRAEGWWNASRPRRIAMVDNPFIPRNANQALVYPSDSYYQPHHTHPNHNIELIDDYEYGVPGLPYREIQQTNMPVYKSNDHNMLAINQLATMDTSKGYPKQLHDNRNHYRSQQSYNHQQIMETNQQQDLVDLIQKTIRMEFNNHQQYQQPARNYNRNSRYNNSTTNVQYKLTVKKLNGSVTFKQGNGQSNTQNNTKPINKTQQHQLNALLTETENKKSKHNKDLYAAIRPERPPEVGTATPYPKIRQAKDKGKQVAGPSVTKRVTTRSHIEEVNPTTRPKVSMQPQHFDVDMDLPIQEKPHHVLRHKADIDIGDLITVAPSLRRKLVSECRPKRKPKQEQTSQQSQQTMALLEDEELNTTAVYSTVSIGDKNIKALVDSGAAKTSSSL